MKTKIKLKLPAIIIAGLIFCAYTAQGQTYGSGALTNTCTVAAGAGGQDGVSIGCGAGKNNCVKSNTFIGEKAGYNTLTDSQNVAVGHKALFLQTGNTCVVGGYPTYNVAVGNYSLYTVNGTSTTGIGNAAIGHNSLYSTNTGNYNTASGYRAGYGNTTGGSNVFIGDNTAQSTNTGSYNVFVGSGSGNANTSGNTNSFLGHASGGYNTSGVGNTFLGDYAGGYKTTGNNNTVTGYWAGLGSITAGSTTYGSNCFYGYYSGNATTTGSENAFYGYGSGSANTTGAYNTAVGRNAGALATTNQYNTFLGYYADVSTNTVSITNATAIGRGAVTNANDKIRLGNSTVTVIEGYPASYTQVSDGRFKFNITDNVKGLEFINKLRPVMYQMDTKKFDDFLIKNMPDSMKTKHQTGMDFVPSTAIVHSGFIAQEVEQTAQEIGYNFDGVHTPQDANGNYGLAYAQFVVPLVKAVQELSKTVDSLKASASGQRIMNNGSNDEKNKQDIKLTMFDEISISEARPNPNDGKAEIDYYLPASVSSAEMIFTDLLGRVINKSKLTPGYGTVAVDTQDLPNGTYTYSLIADGKATDVKKMVKVK